MTRLADLTWPEVDAARPAALAVPLGSTEQHGPHLPLSTDTDLAVELAGRLAAARPDVVVAPPVAYGSSGEHDGFAGTLSIGQEALELLLVELVRSATATFPRVLLVSTHGGNTAPVSRAVARLTGEGRDVRVWSPGWGGRRDAHAAHSETSMQLALDAGRVRTDRLAPGATADLVELLPVMRRSGVRAVTSTGVLGDPTAASADAGAQLLAEAADDLVRTVAEWVDA